MFFLYEAVYIIFIHPFLALMYKLAGEYFMMIQKLIGKALRCSGIALEVLLKEKIIFFALRFLPSAVAGGWLEGLMFSFHPSCRPRIIMSRRLNNQLLHF